jgi:ubiquinone biosynthesis protein COQ9
VRARRQPGSLNAAGAWTVAGIAGDAALAEAMAELIMSSEPRKEARALSHSALFHRVDGRDRERIVELLDNRTTADIARGDTLRQAAQAWLAAAESPVSRSDSTAKALERSDAVERGGERRVR